MNWLAIWFALQIGLSPDSGIITYRPPILRSFENVISTQFEVELRAFDSLFLGGSVRTEITKLNDSTTFTPTLSGYSTWGGVRIGGFEAGGIWTCEHPTAPYYSLRHPVINWDGWWWELYVKVSGEIKLGH